MRRRVSKAQAGFPEFMDGLSEQGRVWMQCALARTVNGDTALSYAKMAIQVKKVSGDYDATSFANYCAALDIHACTGYNAEAEQRVVKKSQRISTLTLRYRKAACMHMCLIEGRPWQPVESWALDRALDGRAADDAPRIPRQALTMQQLAELEDYLRKKGRIDCADGVVVFYGCCLRGQDLKDMTAERTVLEPTGPKLSPVCMSRKKVTEREANLHGGVTYNPIRTDRAFAILKERVEKTPEGPLFPAWNSGTVTLAMHDCKILYGWQGLNYSAHCIRDTAAQHVHDAALEAAALEAARAAGQWDSLNVTYKYAVESAGLRRPSKTPQEACQAHRQRGGEAARDRSGSNDGASCRPRQARRRQEEPGQGQHGYRAEEASGRQRSEGGARQAAKQGRQGQGQAEGQAEQEAVRVNVVLCGGVFLLSVHSVALGPRRITVCSPRSSHLSCLQDIPRGRGPSGTESVVSSARCTAKNLSLSPCHLPAIPWS